MHTWHRLTCAPFCSLIFFILTWGYAYWFLEREGGRGGQRETSMWERTTIWLPSVWSLTRDQTCDLRVCADQGSNPKPLGYRMMLPLTEPPGQGALSFFKAPALPHYYHLNDGYLHSASWVRNASNYNWNKSPVQKYIGYPKHQEIISSSGTSKLK